MSKVVGFVAKLNSKSGTGRNGRPYTLHSLKLSDKEGNELDGWFSCGFNAPPCKEGDYIQLEFTPNAKRPGNFDVVDGSVRVSKNPPAAPKKAQSSGGKGGYSGGGFSPEKDARISWQACRNAAIETVKVMLEAKAIKLVAADTKAGAASRFDLIAESIDKLTVEFFRDIHPEGFEEELRVLRTVSDAGTVSTAGDGELPDSDEDGFEDEEPNFGASDFDDEIPFGDEDDGFE